VAARKKKRRSARAIAAPDALKNVYAFKVPRGKNEARTLTQPEHEEVSDTQLPGARGGHYYPNRFVTGESRELSPGQGREQFKKQTVVYRVSSP